MYLNFTIKDIIQETSDVRSFVLQPEKPFKYKAGQFLTLVKGDIRRSFSFSSHPSDPYPKITLKRIANGEITRWLFDHVKVGDKIQAIEASGLFTYPDDTSGIDSIVFFAAGTGITPIMSLIREGVNRGDKLYLVYSARSRQETLFLNEIPKIDTHIFHSNNKDLQQARLTRSWIENFIQTNHLNPSRTLFYLCGPHIYMQNISITLLTEGVPDDNIRREIFFNPEPPVANLPPDTVMHTVTVRYEGKIHTLKVQFPKTILQTAKENGIMLPYSCEAGRCGTCAATCTSGEVWMLRNEVLLDKEMAKGRVLTCTGFAVGGDADLEIRN
ncbi:MAG TPA: iron-sulfur cluster-binding domain-containing protein [Cyclobacteriaceae bacterium]|nr:iron-sulfur cluster-binding domain-containing protein [Cyclobacteriaceae bacterium]